MTHFLAQAVNDRSREFFRGLQDAVSNTYDPQQAAIFWGSALAFVIVIAIVARQCTRRETQVIQPKKDYLTFAVDLLGLSEEDRRCLMAVARAAELDEPAAMLLTPQNFAAAVASLDSAQHARMSKTIEGLKGRLFGGEIS